MNAGNKGMNDVFLQINRKGFNPNFGYKTAPIYLHKSELFFYCEKILQANVIQKTF